MFYDSRQDARVLYDTRSSTGLTHPDTQPQAVPQGLLIWGLICREILLEPRKWTNYFHRLPTSYVRICSFPESIAVEPPMLYTN